jgi:hypothetical protein
VVDGSLYKVQNEQAADAADRQNTSLEVYPRSGPEGSFRTQSVPLAGPV